MIAHFIKPMHRMSVVIFSCWSLFFQPLPEKGCGFPFCSNRSTKRKWNPLVWKWAQKISMVSTNFDRVWEGTMSDLYYDRSICKNIMVDVLYVLFVIDKFAGAKHLIREMKIVYPKTWIDNLTSWILGDSVQLTASRINFYVVMTFRVPWKSENMYICDPL